MKPSILREITLYRYRYIIVYALVAILLTVLLVTDISGVPAGVHDREAASAVASNNLNIFAPRAADVINLPYHLLQKTSISLFGLSPLTIRLPSIILGFIACGLLAIALNLWFRKNIAAMALVLSIASVPFISMSRTGTAGILYMVMLLVILLGAARLTMQKKGSFIWKLLVVFAGLVLLYMPLGIYAAFALLVAGVFHPHVRYQLKRTKWWEYLVIVLLTGLLVAPIVLACIENTDTIKQLFGISQLRSKLEPAALWASFIALSKALFYFHKPEIGTIITPFFTLPFMLLALFGLARTILDHHAARSYLLHIWLVVSLPLLLLNPTNLPLLFVPVMFLMAIGLETFMREWYQVFPRNPYARIGALVPLSLIIIGILATSTTKYFYGYYYSDTRGTHSPELVAVKQVLKPHVKTTLIVPDAQVAFYDILRSKYRLLTVTSPTNAASVQGAVETIVLDKAAGSSAQAPSTIITSPYRQDGVLLRVYDQTR
jgi:hypothetical protein